MNNTVTIASKLISKYLPPEVKSYVKEGLKTGNPTANKYINSIFTEASNSIKSFAEPYARYAKHMINPISKVVDVQKVGSQAAIAGLAASRGDFSKIKPTIKSALDAADTKVMIDLALIYVPPAKAAQVGPRILQGAQAIRKTKGVAAAEKYVFNELNKARQALVKANPQAAKKIETATNAFKGTIDDVVKKFTPKGNISDYKMATLDEFFGNPEVIKVTNARELDAALGGNDAAFATLLRENGNALKNLADEVGVKSAKEIPNLLKFTKELGSIIQNSPKYLRQVATKQPITLAVTGLDLYDIYQAFKENNDTLIPKLSASAGSIGASLIKGNPLLKILYAGLGYAAGDNLAKAAFKKIGAKRDVSSQLQKEIDEGMAYPGLDEEVKEFETGLSGRKYHIKGAKVYAFDTGRAVPVNEALDDIIAGYNYKKQQANDKKKILDQQEIELNNLAMQGYDVAPQQNLIQEQRRDIDKVLQEIPDYNKPKYDETKDLQQQVIDNEVKPELRTQEANMIAKQESFNELYKQMFDTVAENMYQDMDNYYTPQNQASDYFQYMNKVAQGQALYMSPDEFSRQMKVQAMHNMLPQIHNQTQQLMSSLVTNLYNQGKLGAETNKLVETIRHNKANEVKDIAQLQINATNAQETQRHNLAQEGIGQANAETGRLGAITQAGRNKIMQQNADTASRQQQVREQMLPYQQAASISESVYNMGGPASGVTFDQMLNVNPEVMKQVYPEAFKPSNQPQQPQQQVQQGGGLLNAVNNFINQWRD